MLKVITPPSDEPVSLTEAKSHLRITDTSLDTDIARWIKSAREWVERYLSRFVAEQTVELALDEFPSEIKLYPQFQSVVSFTYFDTDGTQQTLSTSDYVVDTYDEDAAWLIPSDSLGSWASTASAANVVRVRYLAGYTVVPEPIKSAMLLMIGDFDANRAGQTQSPNPYQTNPTVMHLLAPYRTGMGV